MAFERIKARAERREEQHAALPGILGQPCTPAWAFKDPGAGFDYRAAVWTQAAASTPIARGTLKLPTGERMFRIICDGQTAVIHPDDAGWVVRAVESRMTRVKPIWAQAATYRTLPDGSQVRAGVFPWLPQQWTCPECWPLIDMSGNCNSQCTTQLYGGPNTDLRALYGYDNRLMRPWAANANQVPQCGQGAPGGPNTLCMPVEGSCKLWANAKDYIQVFWQDVAQAIGQYNANPPPRETTPTASQPVAAVKEPRRDVNWLPLLAFGLGTGILGAFVWNTRR